MRIETRLYLDSEFNSDEGSLISLALAAEDGKHWYGVWPLPLEHELHPWVRENVIPLLHEMPPTVMLYGKEPNRDRADLLLRHSLREYLMAREGAIIYADWPADFHLLMKVMLGRSFMEAWMVDIGMQLVRTPPGWPRPAIPHNALSDAIALMEWHKLQEGA